VRHPLSRLTRVEKGSQNTTFSTRVSLLSSKIHNGDDTPKD